MVEKLLSEYPTEQWVKCCDYFKDEYWKRHGFMDDCVDQTIISLYGSSDQSDFSFKSEYFNQSSYKVFL